MEAIMILTIIAQELKKNGIELHQSTNAKSITICGPNSKLTLFLKNDNIHITQGQIEYTGGTHTTFKTSSHTIDLNHPDSIEQLINKVKSSLT
jgi:hypothetical protein